MDASARALPLSDVIANTIGAAIGAILLALVLSWRPRSRRA